DLLLAGDVAPGLVVDDANVAVGVAFEPVDRATQPGAGVLDVEAGLGRDIVAVAATRMPAQEVAQGVACLLTLALALPRRFETELTDEPRRTRGIFIERPHGSHDQLLSCACDGDIEQPTLLDQQARLCR